MSMKRQLVKTCGMLKAVFRGKFTAVFAYTKKERSKSNHLKFSLGSKSKLEK